MNSGPAKTLTLVLNGEPQCCGVCSFIHPCQTQALYSNKELLDHYTNAHDQELAVLSDLPNANEKGHRVVIYTWKGSSELPTRTR